jgi:hypothetical protein
MFQQETALSKPHPDAPLCRLNSTVVPSIALTKPQPSRLLGEWKDYSILSRPLADDDKKKVEKKTFYLEYTKPRLIENALPEIAIPFPDDAHLNDNAVTDYKAVVESHRIKLQQRQIDHEYALEERLKSEDWYQGTSSKVSKAQAVQADRKLTVDSINAVKHGSE